MTIYIELLTALSSIILISLLIKRNDRNALASFITVSLASGFLGWYDGAVVYLDNPRADATQEFVSYALSFYISYVTLVCIIYIVLHIICAFLRRLFDKPPATP